MVWHNHVLASSIFPSSIIKMGSVHSCLFLYFLPYYHEEWLFKRYEICPATCEYGLIWKEVEIFESIIWWRLWGVCHLGLSGWFWSTEKCLNRRCPEKTKRPYEEEGGLKLGSSNQETYADIKQEKILPVSLERDHSSDTARFVTSKVR